MIAWMALLALAIGDVPADVVVVRPPAWTAELEPWIRYRQQQGLSVVCVDCDPNPVVVRDRIRQVASDSSGRLRFVLLAGDTSQPSALALPAANTVPTFYVNAKAVHNFGSEKSIASDFPYSDLDDDGIPDLAIGRIPVDTGLELSGVLAKSMAYESSADFQDWRRRVDVTAGVGGFGALADAAVETATKRILTDSIPEHYQLSMTYASPNSAYCPAPHSFGDKVISNLNRGSLFWIYIGHGYVDTLDMFEAGGEQYEIFNSRRMDQVAVTAGPSVAVFMACYTGAFDARVDSLAEQLVTRSNGPVACIAGTRVTMPYGMSVQATGMLDACFVDSVPTLGEIVLQGKRRSLETPDADKDPMSRRALLDGMAGVLSPAGHDLAAEREDHLHLIHLLGDPLLRINYPMSIPLTLPEKVYSGEQCTVTGRCPIDGQLHVELVLRRDRLPKGVQSRTTFENSPEWLRQMDETYDQANQLKVYEVVHDVTRGDFKFSIPVPVGARGMHAVRVFAKGKDQWASGSQVIQVRMKRDSSSK
jgi:Peptidase family C25